MVAILIISAKLATPVFLKINAFWNKSYDVTVSAHDVTIGILSLDSNYFVDLCMWPMFCKFNNLGLALVLGFRGLISAVAKVTKEKLLGLVLLLLQS